MTRWLGRNEGLLVGMSSGANVHAAHEVGAKNWRQRASGVIVTVLCDGATKYLSEPFWNDWNESLRSNPASAGKAMVAHAEAKFPNECCGAMMGTIDGDVKDVTLALPLENAYAGAQGARYELRPEDLLAADRKARAAGPRPDRDFPFAPGLRRVFLEDRSREFLSLVFVRRTVGEGRQVRSRQQLPAQRRTDRRGERRIDMAKVLIPTPLRQFADKHDSVELTGSTVGEVLTSLTTQFPDLRKQLFNDEGKMRSFVNVYLNDEDIRYLKKDATPVAAGDTLSIVPSIAGGVAMSCRDAARRVDDSRTKTKFCATRAT